MAKEEEKKKTKRSTALKRDIQNEKKRLRNRVAKSKLKTAERKLEDALKAGEKEQAQTKLNLVYSLMDKGVKKGILKKNKAARLKSRLAQRCH